MELVNYSTSAGGHSWRYSHALPAPISPGSYHELAFACQIDTPGSAAWGTSEIILPLHLGVANNGDTSDVYRGGITLSVDFDADGRCNVSQADVALPSEDVNVSSGRQWGIRGQFRRGATDPAGTASYFDVLFSRVRLLSGRWQLRIR